VEIRKLCILKYIIDLGTDNVNFSQVNYGLKRGTVSGLEFKFAFLFSRTRNTTILGRQTLTPPRHPPFGYRTDVSHHRSNRMFLFYTVQLDRRATTAFPSTITTTAQIATTQFQWSF
jgi:hypothetical protein